VKINDLLPQQTVFFFNFIFWVAALYLFKYIFCLLLNIRGGILGRCSSEIVGRYRETNGGPERLLSSSGSFWPLMRDAIYTDLILEGVIMRSFSCGHDNWTCFVDESPPSTFVLLP